MSPILFGLALSGRRSFGEAAVDLVFPASDGTCLVGDLLGLAGNSGR